MSNNDIFELKLKAIKIYEIVDPDGESLGLIATTALPHEMDNIVEDYNRSCSKQSDATDIESLIRFIQKTYPAERVFIEETYTLSKEIQ